MNIPNLDDLPLEYFSHQAKLQRAIDAGHIVIKNGKVVITEAGKAAANANPMGLGQAHLGLKTPTTPFNELNPSASRLNSIIAKGKNAQALAAQAPQPVAPSVPTPKPNLFGNFKMVPQMTGGVMKMVKVALKPLAAVGLAADFYDNATGLVSSLQRGEGFASIPGHIQNAFSGSEEEAVAQDVVQPPKGGLSNIPPSEGPANNPQFGQVPTVSSQNEPEVVNDPLLIQPRRKAQSYSPELDPRNAEYLAARDALGPNPSASDVKAVEDLGLATWESIYGQQ